MKVRDVIDRLEREAGTSLEKAARAGVYARPSKPGRVIVSGHGANVDLKSGTYNSIVKQAGSK